MTLISSIGNIIGIKSGDGRSAAFHSQLLEVAGLSDEAAAFIFNKEAEQSTDIEQEFKAWSETTNTELKSSHLDATIRNISINITQICNLHCTYCAAGGDGTYGSPQKKIDIEKTLPQLKILLDKTSSGTVHINFIGGEPLLFPQGIKLIADYLNQEFGNKDLHFKFVLTTNGTLINNDILKILTDIRAYVNVSIDGTPTINDARRPQKNGMGSTSIVLENLKKLIDVKAQLGGLGLTSVFDRNHTEVLKTWMFLSEFPVDWIELNFSHTETSEEASQKFTEEMAQVAAAAYKKGQEKELRKIKAFDHYFNLLDDQQRIENFCGAGKSLVVLDAKNEVYPCPWMVGDKNESLGDRQGLKTAALAGYQEPIAAKNPCTTCWAKFLCGGGCMYIHKNKTGSKTKVDSAFCHRTKDLIANTILYYEDSRREAEVKNETH